MTDKPKKLSPRALAQVRGYYSQQSGGSYGMGGILKRDVKRPPITLRRADYEKAKSDA